MRCQANNQNGSRCNRDEVVLVFTEYEAAGYCREHYDMKYRNSQLKRRLEIRGKK